MDVQFTAQRIGSPILLLIAFCTPASAVSLTAPELSHPDAASQVSVPGKFVIDPRGKQIRLVGPRFYADPFKALDFPGRDENAGQKFRDRKKLEIGSD